VSVDETKINEEFQVGTRTDYQYKGTLPDYTHAPRVYWFINYISKHFIGLKTTELNA